MSGLPNKPDVGEPRFSRFGPHYQPLMLLLAAAAAGIMADRRCPLSPGVWWAVAVGCLAAWLVVRRREGLPARAFCTAALLLAVAATAASWHHCRWHLFAEDELGRFARRQWQPTCVEVVALRAPHRQLSGRFGEEGCVFPVRLIALRDGAEWRPASGRAMLQVSGNLPPPMAGDRLRVFARFSAQPPADNPGGFDLAAHRRADRELCRLQAEMPQCVSLVSRGDWRDLMRLVDYARRQGHRILQQHLDKKQAELASAVLLGLREEVEPARTEAFVTTGTVHVLAISGLHVGILAAALFWLMHNIRFARRWSAAAIAATVVFYAVMVDAGPPVVRAMILVLVACAAICLGRRPLGFNTLAAAGLVVLAVNPAEMFQVGTQLSFLCVAGLIWLAKQRPHYDDINVEDRTLQRLILENLGWLPRMWRTFSRAVVGLALAGAVLWALTLPLVMARFHVCSLAALGMNVLVWPLITLSLLSGFGTLALGAIFPPLGSLCGMICNQSFAWLEGCVQLADKAPCSHFYVPGPSDWWLWGYYGGLGLLLIAPRLLPRRKWRAALLASWIAAGFVAPLTRPNPHQLECTFLNVGHGLAAVVELPSGQTLLYDAGQQGGGKTAARSIANFLWQRGTIHIDAVALSHADADHYNALPELLKRFSVGAVYVSPRMLEQAGDGQHRAWTAVYQELVRRGVPIKTLAAGDRLPGGDGCRLEVLHPARQTRGLLWSDNAQSLTLAVEYQGRRMLLGGDIEPPGLDELLAEEPLPCDVLLAPHHGSRLSNSPRLAAWCRPRWVVLSGDDRANRAEIDATYRAAGGEVLRTCDQGAVRVQITPGGIEVSGFLGNEP
jgi:competence protein ComEC